MIFRNDLCSLCYFVIIMLFCDYLVCRTYKTALVKSILLDVKGAYLDDDCFSLEHMSGAGKGRYQKTPIIGVPYNNGCTTYPKKMTNAKKRQMQYSFGTVVEFMRFSFTSAINQVPFAYVSFVKYQATRGYRTTFEGKLTRREWSASPRDIGKANPYVPCDDFIPSRFVMAHTETHNFNNPNHNRSMDIAFIAMDPERVGEVLSDDGLVTDLGDNVLQYKGGTPHLGVDPDEVINPDLPVDETLGHRHIPANLQKFLKTRF